ncbi:hypothetical protein J2I47_11615 [Fibrella sp. HMF5335]|uniref:Uncharacterized protein n=1 Tax=Fibrella rubiginis TaxID=2817060 RepID=A0A939K5F3_9BACT|nr:hypothetical protein [Fibrella rubiginis]MBO0937196.1 hypothetical protein [Fibrella rubiginis]
MIALSLVAGCDTVSTTETQPPADTLLAITNPLFTIAPTDYSTLAERSINHLAAFDFSAWEATLADDVAYDFPDGDQNTRTKLLGKATVVNWWRNFRHQSGIESMTMSEFNHFPLKVTGQAKGGASTGIYVLSYFTNALVFRGKATGVRMNFVLHFNAEKKIDRYVTYYDRTPIIAAMGGRNLLAEVKLKK